MKRTLNNIPGLRGKPQTGNQTSLEEAGCSPLDGEVHWVALGRSWSTAVGLTEAPLWGAGESVWWAENHGIGVGLQVGNPPAGAQMG